MTVTTVKCNLDSHHMEMAIKDLLAKGAIREVKQQDDHFTSTLCKMRSVKSMSGGFEQQRWL